MEVENEYGTIVVCDKCERGCAINGYGEWFETSKEYEHLCKECNEGGD